MPSVVTWLVVHFLVLDMIAVNFLVSTSDMPCIFVSCLTPRPPCHAQALIVVLCKKVSEYRHGLKVELTKHLHMTRCSTVPWQVSGAI